jgi:hypothetical protein
MQLRLRGRSDFSLCRRGLKLKVDIVVQIDSHLVPPAALYSTSVSLERATKKPLDEVIRAAGGA